jgi:ABC-2 type transport system permease protein
MRMIHLNKRKKLAIYLVISTLLGIGAYAFFANLNYLFSKSPSFVVEEKNLNFVNWTRNDFGYVSESDPQIFIQNINGFVDSIIIYGEMQEDNIQPQVFFAKSTLESFKEENSFSPSFKIDADSITIDINRDVSNLRLDIVNHSGFHMAFRDIVVNSIGLRFNILEALLSAFFVFFVSICSFVFLEMSAYVNNFKKYLFLLSNLVKRDIVTKYRRSVLGLLWSVLNPLLMMMVISVVFQHLFRFDMRNFPMYYLTGSMMFNFVSEATMGSMTSVLGNAGLIRKVYIPKYIFPIERCLFALVNVLFSLIAVVIMYAAFRMVPPVTIFLFPIPILYALIFSMGLGMMLSAATIFFRDITHLYAVWITAWMYLTPVIYPESILTPTLLTVMKFNPMYYYVGYFRQLLLDGTVPNLWTNAVCFFFSFSFLFLGMLVFKIKQDKFIIYI